jgi:integrase
MEWQRCASPAGAQDACERQETWLAARVHGIVPMNTPDIPGVTSPALQMNTSIPLWLEEYRLSHRVESHALMQQTLNEFNRWCKKTTISTITRVDLLRFKQHLIDRGRSNRTAANKCLRINQFIRSVLQLDAGKGPITIRDMKFTEPEVSVFNDDELKAFFLHCDAYHFAIFKTYLMTGLRKQELENLTWDDVDFTAGIVRVTPKKDWQPKTWEARDIEVPDDLLEILKAVERRGKYVFANSAGNRYTHSWDDCQSIAKKANVQDAHPHKFRATFATTLLQNGVDLKTVQSLLGHKDLESTMRYLAKSASKKVRAKLNAVWAGK